MNCSCRPFQKVVVFSKSKISDVRKWIEELFMYTGNVSLLQEFQQWHMPKFPVSGNVLIEHKVPGTNTNVMAK